MGARVNRTVRSVATSLAVGFALDEPREHVALGIAGMFPAIGDQEYDWKAIEETIKAEAEAHPEKLDVVIVTDDGCRFENMIHALDLTRAYGLEKTLLGGGPASTNASMSTPPAAAPAGG
jgi:hypothetical protein